ncbi:hypothetical protein [Candidatus Flexifilum breve]
MNRDVPFAARIAFRLPQALYDKLEVWRIKKIVHWPISSIR